jgi:pyrimidine-nucleoside phosphorylase
MKTVDLIRKKRDGERLNHDEIQFLIDGYIHGNIPDYQISALLMAIYFQGMKDEETADLTDVMANSGTMLDLSKTSGFPVDKHSTGGVGDTTSLVLIPLLAAYGFTVAKLSGRSLGHTGGTIDKLESIAGFRTDLSREEFLKLVDSTGLALADHTEDMVPADRLLYELRDVTSTVDSLPLIVSSIMSKKIAGGARGIVIDVKTGSGAFLKTLKQSRYLAQALVGIGTKLGRKISALITDMSQPLGRMVGNALEVREAIETLRGEGPRDLEELCCALGAELVLFSADITDHSKAVENLRSLLYDGSALNKFVQMLENQGGNASVVDDFSLLPAAKERIQMDASRSGVVVGLDALSIGRAANLLGAGRFTKEDLIDAAVGIELVRKVGEPVEKGEPLAILHVNDESNLQLVKDLVISAYNLGKEKTSPPKLIIDRVIGNKG